MSFRLQSRFARIGGLEFGLSARPLLRFLVIGSSTAAEKSALFCKLPQPFPRYCPALCSFVAMPTKRNQICFLNAQIKVLGKRHDVVNGQASVDEPPVLQTNAAAVKVALENKFCCPLPQLRIAEFVGLGVSLTAVNRLATPRVHLAADVTPTFYLVIHTTIIPHLNRTKRTSFPVYQKTLCKPCERSPRCYSRRPHRQHASNS